MSEVKVESKVIELKRCDFKKLIEEKQKDHFPGTREWMFANIRSFLYSSRRLLWLAGAAGTGKSVVSAKLLETEGVAERIVAWHFCRHDHIAESSVRVIIESWAAMMSERVTGFVISEELKMKALSASTSLEMFTELIANPLNQMGGSSGPLLIVLDALDELPRESVVPVLDLVADAFATLPSFVKLFVTSRKEQAIKTRLDCFDPVEFHVDEVRNRADVRAYCAHVAREHFKMEVSSADLEVNLEREFKIDPGTLHDKLSATEEAMRLSNRIYNDVLRSLKDTSAFRSVCEVKDKQNPGLQQDENDLGRLYEDAKLAHEQLLNVFAGQWEEFKRIESEGNLTILRQPVRGTAAEWVDNVIDPGLKSEASALRKVKSSYGGKACCMRDLVRFTLECENCERLSTVLCRLQQEPDIEVMMLRNKFANPTLLGYCDVNLSIRVKLADNRSHICEVQVNLKEMVNAKEPAHVYYEEVRKMIPAICAEAGISAQQDRFERSVMKMMRRSVLDVAVEQLESKAGGLFLYATLLNRELKSQPGLRDLSTMRELPNGLSEVYERNFARMVGGNPDEWSKYKRVVSMIVVAREPVPERVVQQVVGSGFAEIGRSLSVMFPVRDGRFHVMHKSVVDWLLRLDGLYSLSSEDCDRAHQELATFLLARVHEFCGVPHADYSSVSLENAFALRQVSHHLIAAGEEAHTLVTNFGWLLARVAIGDPAELLADVESVNKKQVRSTTRLVASALRLALGALHEDWRHLAGQLVGRLLGHVAVDDVYGLLERVCRWRGPSQGWWCPVQPTLEPAGGNNVLTCLHPAGVSSAQWSSDGKFICSGSDDHTLRVWEVASGKCVQTLTGHSEGVNSVSWSSDDSKICSGSEDTTVRVWEVASGKCMQTLTGHSSPVSSVSWNNDDSKICSGSYDETVRVWEVESGSVQTFGHATRVTSVSWSKDGSKICSGSADEPVQVWDVASGKCVQTLTGPTEQVSSVSWSSDDSKICSGSDNAMRIWEVASGKCLQTLIGPSEQVNSVSWSSDDSKICSGGYDGTVRVWEVASGKCVQTFSHSAQVNLVSWSKDDSKICSGSSDQTVRVWEVASKSVQTLTGHSDKVISMSWSCDRSKICSGSADKTVRVWDVKSGKCLQTLIGHSRAVTSVSWNNDDSKICSGSDDTTLRMWEVASGKCMQTLTGHSRGVNSMSWSKDDSKICSGSADETVRVWEVASGKCIQTLTGHSNFVKSVSWSSDDTKICSGSWDNTVRVWEAASGKCLQTLTAYSAWVSSVSWSSDDSKICSGNDDNAVRVWEVASGKCVQTLTGPGWMNSVAWSNDDSKICSGSYEKTVQVWEVESGKCLFTASNLAYFAGTFISNKWDFVCKSDGPVGLMSQMRYLMFSPDSTRAFAQMGGDERSIHTLVLFGGSHVDNQTLEFLKRHREAALIAQSTEIDKSEGVDSRAP